MQQSELQSDGLSAPQGRSWARLIFVALILVTVAAYWPATRYPFLNYDDPEFITENLHIRQGLTLAGISWAFQTVVVGNWHPLTCLSHMFDCHVFGVTAGAHHAMNLVFHVANTLLLFRLWRRMTGQQLPAAMVAALFALHPLHVESVAWISERKDVLSTFFGLLALISYAKYAAKAGSTIRPSAFPRSWHYWLAVLLFALGLMSKPMLVTWPFLLLLLDFWPLKRIPISGWPLQKSLRSLLLEKVPFFGLAAVVSVVTLQAQKDAGAVSLLFDFSISHRICNAAISAIQYLAKTFWPLHLSVFYPLQAWPRWQVIGSSLLLVLVTFATLRQSSRRPYFLVGWLWFLGTLMPVIGLIQVGGQAMADRYTYIPLIGPFAAITWGFNDLSRGWHFRKAASGIIAATALIACFCITRLQLTYWASSRTIFQHALNVTSGNYIAHNNLGHALIDDGELDEGLAHLMSALEINPRLAGVHGKIADVLSKQGRTRESISHYQAALREKPDSSGALNNLAWLLATANDAELRDGTEAVRLAERACTLTSYRTTVCVGTLAAAYAEAGRFEEAIATAEKACALANASGENKLAERNEELLRLYRAGQPYREPSKP